jgi:hypothetical protein
MAKTITQQRPAQRPAKAVMQQQPVQKPARDWQAFWSACGTRALIVARAIGRSLFSWSWTKSLLYWLILSGGTMAELAFLVGAIWMSLNATVHPFILMFLSEEQTRYLSFLATSAYVALPELIVGLAVVITIGHIRLFVYNWRKNWVEIIWIVLYGVPAFFFAGLTAYTIGESVAHVGFTMPEQYIVARALAGYLFAFTSLLYWQLGKPQETDRLKKKDLAFAEMRQQKERELAELKAESTQKLGEMERISGARIAELERENYRLLDVITGQNRDLEQQKKQHSELVEALDKSAKSALQAYSQECIDWLMGGVKSVSVEEITRYTGHSTRKVNNAITAGKLRSPGRNKGLILVSSLVEWLEQNPPEAAKAERDTGPILRIVNE